jgi:heme-degrading monooxygenase HmoA
MTEKKAADKKGKKTADKKVKESAMIKGIIGYKVLDYKDVEPILMQLNSYAREYPGFVNAEFLVSEEDHSIGVMISTWETMENWRTWVGSKGTQELLQRARIAVMGMPRITAYRIMPTE